MNMIKEAFVVHEACPVGEVAAVPHESCSRRDGGGHGVQPGSVTTLTTSGVLLGGFTNWR